MAAPPVGTTHAWVRLHITVGLPGVSGMHANMVVTEHMPPVELLVPEPVEVPVLVGLLAVLEVLETVEPTE
jgi:hypothetical protein